MTAPAEIMMAIEQAMGSFFHRVREIETSVLHLLAKPPGVIGKEAGSPAVQTTQRVDERSEKVIAPLLPEVQPYARSLIIKAAAAGIIIKVISGLR
ncbi:MAG: hypothetical protein ABI318_09745, partial [Chthoniobacteraceae bacterium]